MADSWRWLDSTKDLQENTYSYDFDMLPKELARYLEWNLLAAYQELGEVGVEFSWKPWATDEPFYHRDRILNEIVDLLHFLGNMLVAIDVTDEELEVAYKAKQAMNRRRNASGTYSAKKGKLGDGSDNE